MPAEMFRILLASRFSVNSLPQGHVRCCPCDRVDGYVNTDSLQIRNVRKNLFSAEISRPQADRFPESTISPARRQGFSVHSVCFAWRAERKNVRYKESCQYSSTEFLRRMCRHHKRRQSDTQDFLGFLFVMLTHAVHGVES